MYNVTFRVNSYLLDGTVDKAYVSKTYEEALLLADDMRQLMNEHNISFKIIEDWRDGKLFDILIEKFT